MPDRGHAKLPELASKVFHKFYFLSKKRKISVLLWGGFLGFSDESLTKIEFLRNRDSMNCLLFNYVGNNSTSRDYLILILKKLQSFDDVAKVRTFFSAISRCASADFVAEEDQNPKACDKWEVFFQAF